MNKKRLVVIIISLLIIITGFTLLSSFKAVDPKDDEQIEIEVKEGSTTKSISNILKEEKLIKNKKIFELRMKQKEISDKIQPGNYIFSRDMDLRTIIYTLDSGPIRDIVKFTIPEGYELRQIAERLSEMELVNKEKFLILTSNKEIFENEYEFLREIDKGQSLEGFLFPATYEVYTTESEEDIINRMLKAFESLYENELKEKISKSELSFNEIITLASIIEREGKLDEERPIMAAVFYNRIEQGIRLQSCATVQYILGERKPVLTNKDTSTPSEYNTYLHEGLPPAPIAAPGKVSIISALEPADVDYLYFVLTGEDGSHTFSTNYKYHLKAKNKN